MNKSASVCTLVSWKSGQCELLSVDVLMSELIYQISYSAKLRAGRLPSLTLPSFSGTKGSGNKGTLEGGVLKVQTLELWRLSTLLGNASITLWLPSPDSLAERQPALGGQAPYRHHLEMCSKELT